MEDISLEDKPEVFEVENLDTPAEESRYDKQPNFFVGVSLALMLASGGFIFGYDTGTISGFLSLPGYVSRFGELNELGVMEIPSMRSGLIVSIFSIGAIIGALTSSKAADTFGRILTITAYNIIYCLGVIVQLTTQAAWVQVMMGRLVTGISIGGFCVVIPMLISESVPTELRGPIVSSFQLMITLGILVGNSVLYAFRNSTDDRGFKIPLGISLTFAGILFLVLAVMPESPRFLLSVDKPLEACEALGKTVQMEPNSDYILNEIDIMANSVKADQNAGKATWSELLCGKPKIFYRVVIGLVLLTLQQLCGANYFFYYGTSLFKSIGSSNSFANAMILSGVNFACTLIGLWFVSRFNRRSILMMGSLVMLLTFVVFSSLGSFVLIDSTTGLTNPVIGKIMIFFACMFILGFASTWAPLAFVVISEIFPQRIRTKAMSLAICALWLWSFLISFFTPMITSKIGYLYGFVFSGSIFMSIFFIYFGLHETKGLTLEEIDEMYASGVSARKSSSYVANLLSCKNTNEEES